MMSHFRFRKVISESESVLSIFLSLAAKSTEVGSGGSLLDSKFGELIPFSLREKCHSWLLLFPRLGW